MGGHTLGLQQFLQLTSLIHLTNDIAAADELTLHIELGNGRPVGVFLDALTQAGVGQDINALELDADLAEDLDDGGREPALREDRRALHVKDDVVAGNIITDAVENRVAHWPDPWCGQKEVLPGTWRLSSKKSILSGIIRYSFQPVNSPSLTRMQAEIAWQLRLSPRRLPEQAGAPAVATGNRAPTRPRSA